MMDYLRGGADVLVCTSIIESGIDIPQANTLIVEHADSFGLAQLYQIRGRVGRSRERAYAYLLYDSAAALTPEAAQRLAALSDYTELGAGFKIAMRDLEIRGAGNLLGDEQSGHVAALGFELYMQMLDEAVRAAEPEQEGETLPEPVRLDVNVDAYVPADYIPYEQAKIEVHRRVARRARGGRRGAPARGARGPLRPPCRSRSRTCSRCSARGSSSGRPARARSASAATAWRSCRSSSTRARAKRLREELPEALYESGRSQVSMRVPKDGIGALPERRAGRPTRCSRSCARRLRNSLSTTSRSSATVPAVVSMTPRSFAALGAVLFALVGLSACGGGGCPATPSCRSTARRSPRRLQPLDGRGRRLDTAGTSVGKPVAPEPPELHGLHRAPAGTGETETRGQEDQSAADDAQLEDTVRNAVQIALAGGARLPDLLRVGDRRSQLARREAVRRRSQEAVRENQAPAVPESRRIRKIPRDAPARRSPTCCCA